MLASIGSCATLDDEWGIGTSSLRCCSVQTKGKRNMSMWYVRRVSFWNDCDEPIQEWLSNVQELAESEDPLLWDEGQGEP